MFSQEYYSAVDKMKKYHLENKTYSGGGTLAYAEIIKKLVKKHNVKTLLDYGCGKGLQYESGSIINFGNNNQTFDEYLDLASVYKFDPGVEKFAEYPPLDSKFDAIIAIQSLSAIPTKDLPLVVTHLMNMSTKFCFVGTNLSLGKKKKRGENLDQEYTKEEIERTDPNWWYELFKNWQGSELVLHFLPS
jgi:hypothetical protein